MESNRRANAANAVPNAQSATENAPAGVSAANDPPKKDMNPENAQANMGNHVKA